MNISLLFREEYIFQPDCLLYIGTYWVLAIAIANFDSIFWRSKWKNLAGTSQQCSAFVLLHDRFIFPFQDLATVQLFLCMLGTAFVCWDQLHWSASCSFEWPIFLARTRQRCSFFSSFGGPVFLAGTMQQWDEVVLLHVRLVFPGNVKCICSKAWPVLLADTRQ